MRRFYRLLAALLLCLALNGCTKQSALPERPGIVREFSQSEWQLLRAAMPENPTPIDLIETTDTREEPGAAFARLLGQELLLYVPYAQELEESLTDLDAEFVLMTALLNTDGTTVGDTGANSPLAYYVDEQLGGRGVFITEEQVEAAARRCFGEETEVEHRSVPETAAAEEQFVYHPEFGVYSLPAHQPIYYLPLVLTVQQTTFNTWEVELVFVRYADADHNAFFGLGSDPVARWDMEFYVNFNRDRYKVYTATMREQFGDYRLESLRPARA